MSTVVALLVGGPILAGAVGLLARKQPVIRDVVTLGSLVATAAGAVWLLRAVESGGPVVVRVGDWHPELGIVLVADLFAALILMVAVATIMVVEFFAIAQRRTAWGADPELAGPVLLVLTSGVSLAFLTGAVTGARLSLFGPASLLDAQNFMPTD